MMIEPKDINKFERNNVWELDLKRRTNLVIRTRWIFGNKLGEDDIFLRNKTRLVAKGCN